MTPGLLIARGLIVHWVTLWLAPVEYAFDMIESELERRGVDPTNPIVPNALTLASPISRMRAVAAGSQALAAPIELAYLFFGISIGT